MKKLTLVSILILLVLLTAAWAPSALPALQPAAGQAAGAQQAATGTPTAATQAVATPLPRPDQIHLPGIYVHRIIVNAHPEKRIEKRTLSESAK